MLQDDLKSRYFEWLYGLVYGDNNYGKLSYRKLFLTLHDMEFIYILEFDKHRALDGINLRYRFGYENGYSKDIIENDLDNTPCSVLEMLIALAIRGEEQIMYNEDCGDRAGQWFWNMIVSLELGSMHDSNFNEGYVYHTINKFLHRDYEPNGKGGLFTIENCKYDLRDVDIWVQFMWYLDVIIMGE